jgi:TctA family transporter
VEEGLVQSMLAGKAAGSTFIYMVYRPISGVLIFLCVMSLLWPIFAALKARHKKACVDNTSSSEEKEGRNESK